jgi:hypothetical protein
MKVFIPFPRLSLHLVRYRGLELGQNRNRLLTCRYRNRQIQSISSDAVLTTNPLGGGLSTGE